MGRRLPRAGSRVRRGVTVAAAALAGVLPSALPAEAAAPPAVPELVAPASGYVFGTVEPQVFTVRTVDPDGDRWVGIIEVTNVDTGQVTTFPTGPATSGAFAGSLAVPPLTLGRYTWRARAADTTAGVGDWSASSAFRVGTNHAPNPPVLLSPAPGATLRRFANDPFSISAVDEDGDPFTGSITIRTAAGVMVEEVHTSPAPSGGVSSGVVVGPLAEGAYTWSAVATDVHGAPSGVSATRSFTVGPPTTGGGGALTGKVTFGNGGIPPVMGTCEPAAPTFDLHAAAAVFNTAIVGYVGPLDLDGTGTSPCESALSGSGTATFDISGTGTTSSTLRCDDLSGSYQRYGAVLVVSLSGGCVVNALPVSRVTFVAALAFAADDPRTALTAPLETASLGGSFAARPH